MKLNRLLLVMSFLTCLIISAQETPGSFPFSNYLINYGGCIGSDSLELKSLGNDLFRDRENNLYFLSYDRSDETGKRKTPIFIKRFRTNCDGEVYASDSIYDHRKTIDLATFQELGDGYYKDYSNKYYFESMADGGEFRIVYNDLRTYIALRHHFFLGDDGKMYIRTQRLISPPENFGPTFYREVPYVDLNTFKRFDGSLGYAKDKNHIYWEYGTSDGEFIRIVPEADLESFEDLGSGLAKDKHAVYYQSSVVEGLKPQDVKSYQDYEKFEEDRRRNK